MLLPIFKSILIESNKTLPLLILWDNIIINVIISLKRIRFLLPKILFITCWLITLQATAKQLHWIFSVPVGVVISIAGLIGNGLSLLVWKRVLKKNFGRNKSTAMYLIALALADSALLFFFLLDDSLPKILPSLESTMSFCYFHAYVGFPFFFLSIVVSIWLLVCVTLNRFLLVNFPIKAKSYCSTARANIGIGATIACCFVVNLPHFFNFSPKPGNGNTTKCITLSDYGKSNGSINYEFWVHCIFLVLAPWASIAFCNAGIVYGLHKRARKMAKKFSKQLNDNSDKDRQMTRMLLVVTFTFLILLAWQCITQCFYMLGYDGKTGPRWNNVDKSFAMAKLGVVINSSINFFLYSCTGSVFRKELQALLGIGRESRYKPDSGNSVTKNTNDSFVHSESKL